MKKLLLPMLLWLVTGSCLAQTFLGGSRFGSTGIDNAQYTFFDASGNMYVCGLFGTDITFASTNTSFSGGNVDGFLAKYDARGNEIWLKKFGGSNDDVVKIGAVDKQGNIYLTGYFQGITFDADPSPTASYILKQPATILSRDCYVVKLNANGDFVWAKQISNTEGGALNEDPYSLKCDSKGNVYIGGRFSQADFDTSPNVQLTTSYGINFATDGFVVKLNPNGDLVWVKKFGGVGNDVATAMDIDAKDNIYVAGTFADIADFDPSDAGLGRATSFGNTDIFIVKLDSSGNYKFHRSLGGVSIDVPNELKIDKQGNIYVGGYFNGTMDINTDSTAVTNVVSNGSTDAFVLKLDSLGNYANHYVLGSTGIDQIYSVDFTDKNVLIGGTYSATVDFNSSAVTSNSTALGSTDLFFLKLDNTFKYTKHFTFGSTGNESLAFVIAKGDTVHLVGTFQNSLDLNPQAVDSNMVTSIGQTDVFYTRFIEKTTTNVKELPQGKSVLIAPNPFTDKITLEQNDYTDYNLYSIDSRLMQKGKIENNTINLSEVNQGFYILELFNKNERFTTKVFKK